MEMSIMEAKKFLSQPELGLNKQHFQGAIAKYPAPLFPLGGIIRRMSQNLIGLFFCK